MNSLIPQIQTRFNIAVSQNEKHRQLCFVIRHSFQLPKLKNKIHNFYNLQLVKGLAKAHDLSVLIH